MMRKICEDELNDLLATHQPMVVGDQELRVLTTNDEQVIKVFRRRKLLTSGLWAPPAKRFQENAHQLLQLNICAPQVMEYLYCPPKNTHIVTYPKIPGQDIRELVHLKGLNVIARLPAFLSHLHESGVYFRAIHLGNILSVDNNRLGLIDISDLSVKHRPLRIWERGRNLAHIFNNKDDEQDLMRFGISEFMKRYVHHSGLNERETRWLFYNMRWRLRNPSLITGVKEGLRLSFSSGGE